jgi:DNA-binding winged helix-turn-helix (wHTH) protein/tetratricopeptide (TPR) repeat protein
LLTDRSQPAQPADGPDQRPIDLAREQPFRLGSLVVTPALRELVAADGARQTLEPRVMQVLVALKRANGAMVGRDDLIRTCWGGTVVGEGSINRTISLLRKAAEGIGNEAFRINTVPRVGYRLILAGSTRAGDPTPSVSGFARPRWLTLAALALLAAVAAGAFILLRPVAEGPTYSVSVRPFRISGAAQSFDQELLSTLTSQNVPTAAGRVELVLTGTVEERSGAVRVNAQMVDPRSDEVVWSGAIDRSPAEPGGASAAAAIVGTVAQCTLAGANDAGTPLPLDLLSGYARTCELGYRGQSAQGVRVARELTRRAPDFAAGWFALSYHAGVLYFGQPTEDPRLREEAMRAADKLIALRPDAQDGYVSKFTIMDPARVEERERLLLRAIEREPIYFDGAQAVLSDFMMESGRLEEAYQLRRAAQQQRPDLAGSHRAVFVAAAATGRWRVAEQALAQAAKIDPRLMASMRWRQAVWARNWAEAERHMPVEHPAQERATIAAYRALASDDPAKKQAAAAQVVALPEDCCVRLRIELLTQLDRPVEAIALLDRYGSTRTPGTRRGLPFLWEPALQSLWYDPAFEPFVRRSGWPAYWRQARVVPDLCKEASPPSFCRLLAER